MTYEIIYTPRVQDEVVVAKFSTLEEATNYMELIKKEKPQAVKYHRIEEIKDWPFQDSGIENFV
jgi:hypothetical protein